MKVYNLLAFKGLQVLSFGEDLVGATQYHYIKGDFSHLKSEPIELSWTNESGQIVKRQIVQKEDILSMQFDVGAFGKGIYFVAAMQGTTYLGTKGLIIE